LLESAKLSILGLLNFKVVWAYPMPSILYLVKSSTTHKGNVTTMDFLFIILLVMMLIMVGYAKVQQGVVKTPGTISLHEDEEQFLNSGTK
jgi:hypothetical protein